MIGEFALVSASPIAQSNSLDFYAMRLTLIVAAGGVSRRLAL